MTKHLSLIIKPKRCHPYCFFLFFCVFLCFFFHFKENPSNNCSWSDYSYSSNCNYIGQLISAANENNASVGIYSSDEEWANVMGSSKSCTNYTNYPLWYAHYDNKKSFSDFQSVSFGGWTNPNVKQYQGDTSMCNVDVDLDWYCC